MSKVRLFYDERGHQVVTYLYVLLLSWLWGSLRLPIDKGWRGAVMAVGKGAAAVFAAKMVNDTGLTMTVALLGVISGQAWSPLLRFKERPALWVAWGALLVFAPLAGALAALTALLIYYLAGSAAVAQLGVALFIPFLLWQIKEFDIYVIFGLINTVVLTYQAIPLLNPDGAALRKRLRVRQLLAVILIIFVASTLFFTRYVYQGFGKQLDIFRRGTAEFKIVALTFDDGPDPAYTPAILDILKEYNVPATFFMVGRHVEQYPGLARRIADEGHTLGNHTWSHRSLVPLSVDYTRSEIMRSHEMIEQVTGVTPKYFRPPRGVYSAFALDLLRKEGYTTVLWNLTSQDWAELPARRIAAQVLNRTGPGSILLFHDSGNLISAEGGDRINTLRALPRVIEGLQEEGYRFMTIEELVILTGLTAEDEGDL